MDLNNGRHCTTKTDLKARGPARALWLLGVGENEKRADQARAYIRILSTVLPQFINSDTAACRSAGRYARCGPD